MPEQDDPIAKLGRDLGEDQKAKRKTKGSDALKAGAAHLAGADGTADDGGTVQDALASLGNAVAQKEDEANAGLDLSERAHTLAIERMETLGLEAVLNDKSLVADLRDAMLDQIKARPKPWSGTSEAEKRDVAAALEQVAIGWTRRMVEMVATAGKVDPVRVLLTKVTLGEDMVLTGKVKTFTPEEETSAVDILHKARGKHVMLTPASVDDYRGDARDAEIEPDQHTMGFDAGSDDLAEQED